MHEREKEKCGKTLNEELHEFHFRPNIIRVMKLWRMNCVNHVTDKYNYILENSTNGLLLKSGRKARLGTVVV